MALDRQLSRNFWLREASGFEDATEAEVAELAETVARVLQPIRTEFGVPVRISSWQTWSSGERRTGSHSHAGTVDFVVGGGLTRDAFEWASSALTPAGYIGRLIYEPSRSSAEGRAQGEHIHMAPRGAMVEVFGDPNIQVLEERAEGEYVFYRVATGLGLGAIAALAGFFWLASKRGAAA